MSLVPVLVMNIGSPLDLKALFNALRLPFEPKALWYLYFFYEKFVSLTVSDFRLLDECNTFDLKIANTFCDLITLYKSPSLRQKCPNM